MYIYLHSFLLVITSFLCLSNSYSHSAVRRSGHRDRQGDRGVRLHPLREDQLFIAVSTGSVSLHFHLKARLKAASLTDALREPMAAPPGGEAAPTLRIEKKKTKKKKLRRIWLSQEKLAAAETPQCIIIRL